jgi:hypothetical protein
LRLLLALTLLFVLCDCSHVKTCGLNAKYTVQRMVYQPTLISGKPADPEEWPASVYARMQNAACSATLIGERVLLIASHCVKNGEKVSFSAHANNYTAKCTHHPEYDRGDVTADWALCLVERPVTGVLFESLGVDEKLSIGEEVTLSGYGCVTPGGGGGNDGIFRIGTAKIQGLPSQDDYDVVTKGGAALCFGDSGGSAYIVKDDKRVIFGVNSRGDIHTMSYLPAISVKTFIDWANRWTKTSNNVQICGLHSDALFCRNDNVKPGPGPIDPYFELDTKTAFVKGFVHKDFFNRKEEVKANLKQTLDSMKKGKPNAIHSLVNDVD